MNEPPFTNPFIFNPLIDPNIIHDLYENDYQYIEEIFGTVLNHFHADLEAIRLSFASGNAEVLRKSVHKIKPTFGFLGMQALEQQCKAVEENCRKATSAHELVSQVNGLIQAMEKAQKAIEEDLQKLIIYNNSES